MKSIRRKKLKEDDSTDYPYYRSFPLWVILSCGLICLIFGIYLCVRDDYMVGRSLSRWGQTSGGGQMIVNGPFLIVFGIAFSIFPTYQLIKQYLQKRRKT